MEKSSAAEKSWSEELWEAGPAIAELQAILREPRGASRLQMQFTEPMDIEQLEMLEAELANQSILPPESTTLSQHALHSASILRWRARRAGTSADSVYFLVRVPEYVLMRAGEIRRELETRHPTRTEDAEALLLLRSGSWGKGFDSRTRLLQDLNYLERFAGYLLGRLGVDTNRYQRGLSLILKIIGNTRQLFGGEDERVTVELPIEPREFTQRLRAGL